MGYYTRHTGSIAIEPPLNHQEVQKFNQIDQGDLRLIVGNVRKETPDGSLLTDTGYSIEPRTEEEYKGYWFLDALKEVAKLFGETHKFNGYILAEGEESGDIHRYVIRGTEAKDQKATFTFEDD